MEKVSLTLAGITVLIHEHLVHHFSHTSFFKVENSKLFLRWSGLVRDRTRIPHSKYADFTMKVICVMEYYCY